jgi:hypothetical protein
MVSGSAMTMDWMIKTSIPGYAAQLQRYGKSLIFLRYRRDKLVLYPVEKGTKK